MLPSIEISPQATLLETDLEGNIFATYQGKRTKVGQLVLAVFPPSEAFQADGVVLKADDPSQTRQPGGRPARRDPAWWPTSLIATPKITVAPPAAKSPTKPQTQEPRSSLIIPDDLANRFLVTANSAKPKMGPKPLPAGSRAADNGTGAFGCKGGEDPLGPDRPINGDPGLVATASAIEVGDTPATGLKRIIDRSRVLGGLRMNGFKPEAIDPSVPDDAGVWREGRSITRTASLWSTAIKSVIDKEESSGTWESTDSFSDLEVPSGKLELRAETTIGGRENGEGKCTRRSHSISFGMLVIGGSGGETCPFARDRWSPRYSLVRRSRSS